MGMSLVLKIRSQAIVSSQDRESSGAVNRKRANSAVSDSVIVRLEQKSRLYSTGSPTPYYTHPGHPVSPSCKHTMEVPVDFPNVVEWGTMFCLASPAHSKPDLFSHRWRIRRWTLHLEKEIVIDVHQLKRFKARKTRTFFSLCEMCHGDRTLRNYVYIASVHFPESSK